MEALAERFMAAVRDLRARASGEDPPGESATEHWVKDVERGTRGAVTKVEDLSES
jgi:hypothetical protein